MSQKITSSHLNSTRKTDSEDLLHDIIIYLEKFPEEKILGLIQKKQLSFFIARMMMFQYHSNTSKFYKTYVKPRKYNVISNNLASSDNAEIIKQKKLNEKKLDKIDNILKDLNWFEVEAFKIYYKDKHSYSTLAKATKISKNTLYKSIRKVHDYIKYKINE
tara:strand:- start:1232 stop:1714 length:483 start_codon:yes stop_codon:yes gene_type:complete